jgi:hypothetical protein
VTALLNLLQGGSFQDHSEGYENWVNYRWHCELHFSKDIATEKKGGVGFTVYYDDGDSYNYHRDIAEPFEDFIHEFLQNNFVRLAQEAIVEYRQ